MAKRHFSAVLDAASSLPLDDQEELVHILNKRAVAERRKVIVKDIKAARAEYKQGKCLKVGAAELMKELMS